MSLQVWLPLNGDLHNQGLSNIVFSNNGATTNTTGKIGTCYNFNGSSNYLYSNYKFYNNKYSICAWVYSTSSTATQTICCDRTATGSGLAIFLINGKLRIDPGGNNLQWTTNYTYPIKTWFHLTITYDGTNVSYYINGEKKETKAQTISSSYWGNITSIGASQTNGSGYGNYLNGKLNDVRIYNHCLSDKEVEEISKGLVLHYKLDNSISNIIYDCSGYNNNGTIVGSLEAVTTTSRYSQAMSFNGSSIIAIGTQLYDMKDEMTVNLWINKTWNSNTGTPFSSVQGGGFGWQVSNANYTFYCGTGATSNTYISKAITTNSLSAGWHMLSATYDGLALRLYIDGEISSTTSKYTTKTPLYYNSASGMFVGGESAGAVNTTTTDRFNGQISDVRIYATALTDNQIKELYDTSATIDNKGNIHAREYLENNNLNINKQGQFQENILVDDNDLIQASILKTDKQIQGFTVYEY